MRVPFLFFLLFFSLPAFTQNDSISRRGHKFIYTGDKHLFNRRYDSIRGFSEGRAAVMKDGKWGFIDTQGRRITPLKFARVGNFTGGFTFAKDFNESTYHTVLINGFEWGDWHDTIILIDSLSIGVNYRRESESTDTVYTIHKYPRTALVYNAEHITINDTFVYVNFGKYDAEWHNYALRNHAQLLSTHGTPLTPLIFAVDSIFQEHVIATMPEKKKQAVISRNGLVSPWYDSVVPLDSLYFDAGSHRRHGVINASTMQLIIPALYKSVQDAGNNFILQKDSTSFLADVNGKSLSVDCAGLYYLGDGFSAGRIHKNDTVVHIMNANGEFLPGEYYFVFPFHEGIARVVNTNNYREYAYVDNSGKQITPWYHRQSSYQTGGAGGRNAFVDFIGALFGSVTFGIVDLRQSGGGNAVATRLPPFTFPNADEKTKYFYGTDFRDDIAITTVRRKLKKGEKPPQFTSLRYDSAGVSEIIHIDEIVWYGVIDTTGKVVLNHEYSYIYREDSVLAVTSPKGHGLASFTGEWILPPEYAEISSLGNGFYKVRHRTRSNFALYRLLSPDSGVFLSDYVYERIAPPHDSLFMVFSNWKFGYVDYSGHLVIPMIYGTANPFEKGKAKVGMAWMDQETFFIDKSGKRVQ